MVDGLDFDAVRRDPRPLIGFSDITALHPALRNEVGLVGIHRYFVNWYAR
ncbi:LD-carboxypeptidase [Pseudonocardia sp.]|jgi:muramoyltetrapeptide carboxypeptidase